MSLAQWVSKRSRVSVLLQALGVLRAQIPASLFQAWEVRDIAVLWWKNVRGTLSIPVQSKPCAQGCGERPQVEKRVVLLLRVMASVRPLVRSPGLGLQEGPAELQNGVLSSMPEVGVQIADGLQNSPLWRACMITSYSSDAAVVQNVFGNLALELHLRPSVVPSSFWGGVLLFIELPLQILKIPSLNLYMDMNLLLLSPIGNEW